MHWRARLAHIIAGPYAQQLASVTARVDDSPGWTSHTGREHDRDLAEVQQIYTDTLTAWRKNPLAKRITEITTDYVCGDAITLSSPDSDLNEFIQKFWSHRKNRMQFRLTTMCDELGRAGDLFPVLFTNDVDGMSYIRFVTKDKIIGIQTADNDWESEVSYEETRPNSLEPITWYGPAAKKPGEPLMLHYSVNRPLGALLGEGDMTSMLPWLLRYSRMLDDRVRLNWALRAFLWVVTVPPNKVAAKREQYRRPPEAGSIVVTDGSETWEPLSPNLRGADARYDIAAIRNMIDTGTGFPAHWLNTPGSEPRGIVSGGAFAALHAPAERRLQRRQDYFVFILQDVIWHAWQRNTQKNGQTDQPSPDYDQLIHVEKPEISRSDNIDLATAAKTLARTWSEINMTEPKSRTLASKWLGYIFRFMGEPQPEATITRIVDEIYANMERDLEEETQNGG